LNAAREATGIDSHAQQRLRRLAARAAGRRCYKSAAAARHRGGRAADTEREAEAEREHVEDGVEDKLVARRVGEFEARAGRSADGEPECSAASSGGNGRTLSGAQQLRRTREREEREPPRDVRGLNNHGEALDPEREDPVAGGRDSHGGRPASVCDCRK
jgi:hypothetical protein